MLLEREGNIKNLLTSAVHFEGNLSHDKDGCEDNQREDNSVFHRVNTKTLLYLLEKMVSPRKLN